MTRRREGLRAIAVGQPIPDIHTTHPSDNNAGEPIRKRGDMTTEPTPNFIIVGLTREGRKFRPSDWAERLCGVMSAFGAEKKMKYSPFVGPCTFQGEKAVFVDAQLGRLELMAYKFMLNFANDNELQVVENVERPHN